MEAIHRAYVQAASEFFTERHWPTTSSRLGVFTGLTKHQVEKVQADLQEAAPIEPSKSNQISRLLTTWHIDPRYTLPMVGTPRELPIASAAGSKEISFSALARECAPYMDATDLLDELLRLGTITMHEDPSNEDDVSEAERRKLIRVQNRAFVLEPYDAAAIEWLGRIFAALAETLDANFSKKGTSEERFERRVTADYPLSAKSEEEFRHKARELGQATLEKLDEWLAAQPRVAENGRRVGVEIFHFVETGISDAPAGVGEGPQPEPGEIDTLSWLKN
jgi:hypothetical protein